MTERGSKVRAFWLVYAILQMALPGVASIADARLEAESIRERPTSHAEEHGSPNCARVHPADCAFCRILSAAARPAASDSDSPVALLRIAPPSDGQADFARLSRLSTRSRAPPVV